MTRRAYRRPGFTMIEMIVVVAVVLIIGGVLLPTLAGLAGNSKVKAAADAVKARLMEARLNAMEQGRPYVFSISTDGLKMRVAPDEAVEAEVGEDGQSLPAVVIEEDLPDEINLKLTTPQNGTTASTTANGYTKVVTFQPDGTCAEDSATLGVQENGRSGMVVTIRGLTGAVFLAKPTSATGGVVK